jgi:hypothetical protein
LENSRQTRKTIISLKINGNVISDETKILKETVNYYRTLYTSSKISTNHIKTYLNNIQYENKLSDEDASKCEGYLNINEIKPAVNGLKPNKSPEIDGIPAEFYQEFFYCVGLHLTECLNECFDKTLLSHSQKN